MFDLNDCAAFLVNKTSKILAERLEKRFSSFHVTRVQWLAMYFIGRTPEITQKNLAECLGTTEPTVVSLLDRLERDGMIVREASPKDRRIRLLRLTPKGRQLSRKLTAVAEKFKNDAIAGISDEALEQYKSVIGRMLSNTEEK